MTKKIGLLVGPALLISAALATGADEEAPTNKQIMAKLHKGPNSSLTQLKAAVGASDPDWDKIQGLAKEFVTSATQLEKNEPKKGSPDSWKKLTGLYLADAKMLDDAAQGKNKAAAHAAEKKLGASCKACHKHHK